MKPDSLYNYGMRPLLYSLINTAKHRIGWMRTGENICYFQNNIRKRTAGFYYTLTFTITFAYDNDTVFFAHSYPYTYTQLNRYIKGILADPKKKNRCRNRTLCRTLGGNECHVLTITSFSCDSESMAARKGVVLMARVHPGESNASWMMQGVIEYLVGPTLDAKILRDNFIFKIVPMLNPDGVVNGSYRTSLAGVDLNRCWVEPSKIKHPTVFHSKTMIRQFNEEREIVLCADFHGHSRKRNIFMYGCTGRSRLKERIFPKLLEGVSEIFSFKDCVFGIQKAKEGTARIVLYKEMGIINSYTLESSFSGASFGKYADFHFNTDHLLEIGHNFCDAILDFCDPEQSKVKTVLEELETMYPKASDDETDDDAVDSDYSSDEARKRKRKRKNLKKKSSQEKRKAK